MKLTDKTLPKEITEQKTSPQILSQAVRVHLANQRQGTQSALTRAEISRTRKKYQKQKGSGNARHGDRKAPIFVGGGVTFAPKPRDHSLKMSSQMRRQAIFGALAAKAQTKSVFVISGMGELSGKTSEVAGFLQTLKNDAEKNMQNVLIITDSIRNNVYLAGRNIAGVTVSPVNLINTYEVLKADKILVMEEAINLFGKQPEAESSKEEVTAKPVVKKAVPTKKPLAKKPTAVKKTVKKAVKK